MKKIINFLRRIFSNKEMTPEEEQEVIAKIIKKIKEN